VASTGRAGAVSRKHHVSAGYVICVCPAGGHFDVAHRVCGTLRADIVKQHMLVDRIRRRRLRHAPDGRPCETETSEAARHSLDVVIVTVCLVVSRSCPVAGIKLKSAPEAHCSPRPARSRTKSVGEVSYATSYSRYLIRGFRDNVGDVRCGSSSEDYSNWPARFRHAGTRPSQSGACHRTAPSQAEAVRPPGWRGNASTESPENASRAECQSLLSFAKDCHPEENVSDIVP